MVNLSTMFSLLWPIYLPITFSKLIQWFIHSIKLLLANKSNYLSTSIYFLSITINWPFQLHPSLKTFCLWGMDVLNYFLLANFNHLPIT